MEGQQSSGGVALSEAVTRLEELEQRVEGLEAENEDLRKENEQLRDRVDELEDDQDDLQSEFWELEEYLYGEYGYGLGATKLKKKGVLERLEEVDDLVDRIEDGDLQDKPEPGPSVKTETPLEDVVALPDNIAESELTANQRRARFVASDITDYATFTGKTAGGGYALSSSDLRRVLVARFDDVAGHAETVRRIVDWLDELGQDTVRISKRDGERRVVFEEEGARRLAKLGGLETHVSVSEVPG